MRKFHFYSILLIAFISVSSLVSGQYTGGNPNVALDVEGFASDSLDGFGPARALDGDPATYLSIPGDAPAWIEIDLGAFFLIDGFGFDYRDAVTIDMVFTFQVSEDGSSWTALGGGTVDSDGTWGYDVVSPDPIKFVRFEISDKDPAVNLTEIYVYGFELPVPQQPVAVEATSVLLDGFTANWDPVLLADGYVLSVALDEDFTNFVPGYQDFWAANSEEHQLTGLEPATQYFYKVRAYNLSGTGFFGNAISVTTLQESQDISFTALDAATYGDADVTLTASASSGLEVEYVSSDESVATVSGNTLSIVGVGSTTITASQPGNTQYLPADPVDQVLAVGAKELTVTGAEAADKVYDGTTDAVVSGATLDGVVGDDDVSLDGAAAGEFAQAIVGTDIAVSVDMSLSGADAGNYTLVQPTGLAADITVKDLTVSGAAAENKVYDGNTDAVVAGAVLDGVLAGDDVVLEGASAGVFAQADAGAGIAVSVSMSVSGADAANYSFEASTGLSADITAKELTVTAEDKSREKCFENPEFTIAYAGFVGTEDESVLDAAPSASCDATAESAAGTYDIIVSGGSDANYAFAYVNGTLTVTPDVTPPELEVKDITLQLPESETISITADDVVVSTSDNCEVGDVVLSQSVFTTSDVGTVDVTVTLSDVSGNETTAVSKVTVLAYVGIEDVQGQMARVYPNPTYGVLQIELDRPADGLRVMDLTGKTVLSRSTVGVEDSIDLEEFNAGIYVIALQFGEEVIYYKIVKK